MNPLIRNIGGYAMSSLDNDFTWTPHNVVQPSVLQRGCISKLPPPTWTVPHHIALPPNKALSTTRRETTSHNLSD